MLLAMCFSCLVVWAVFLEQGIADVVETLLEDVDSYLDDASGKGANQQVGCFYVFGG